MVESNSQIDRNKILKYSSIFSIVLLTMGLLVKTNSISRQKINLIGTWHVAYNTIDNKGSGEVLWTFSADNKVSMKMVFTDGSKSVSFGSPMNYKFESSILKIYEKELVKQFKVSQIGNKTLKCENTSNNTILFLKQTEKK